jgi:hypothetical protein
MFRCTAIVARQRSVKHISMNTLASPAVHHTLGGTAVARQSTLGWIGLCIGAARVLCKEGAT